jgi:hypothetical protein
MDLEDGEGEESVSDEEETFEPEDDGSAADHEDDELADIFDDGDEDDKDIE